MFTPWPLLWKASHPFVLFVAVFIVKHKRYIHQRKHRTRALTGTESLRRWGLGWFDGGGCGGEKEEGGGGEGGIDK